MKLGVLLEELGEHSRALTHLTNAEKEDSKNLEIKLHLARTYLALGKGIRAEKPLKDILEVNPNHEEAKSLLRTCV